jgi:hypothetical protein
MIAVSPANLLQQISGTLFVSAHADTIIFWRLACDVIAALARAIMAAVYHTTGFSSRFSIVFIFSNPLRRQ